jgi:hypothetical protein
VVTDQKAAVCNVHLSIAAVGHWPHPDDNPAIEIKGLLTFLVDHPSIKVSFDGEGMWSSEARDLDMLLLLARTMPAFCKVLKTLRGVEVLTSFWPRDERLTESRPLWALNISYSTWKLCTVEDCDKRMFDMMEAMGLHSESSLTFEPEQYPRLRKSKLFAGMKILSTMT